MGRIHAEEEHPFRGVFARDRDRIIHSKAFRRLEYKTQVFVNHEGDHYRTRLTHSIEVAQIARTISRALGLNEDLTETIALAHDLGHPPFGHAGERCLDKYMREFGGFEHNKQTVKIVEELEKKYPRFDGLNLTRITLRGLMKHGGLYESSRLSAELGSFRLPLEAEAVDIADAIAYSCHDLDDGISGGYIHKEQMRHIELWDYYYISCSGEFPGYRDDLLIRYVILQIVNYLVSDIVEYSRKQMAAAGANYRNYKNFIQSRAGGGARLIVLSPEAGSRLDALKAFLRKNLYNHERVIRMSGNGAGVVAALYEYYLEMPEKLPDNFRSRVGFELLVDSPPVRRLISDYLAGMTDRFAIQEYERIFNKKK